jgi:hypothetical protein
MVERKYYRKIYKENKKSRRIFFALKLFSFSFLFFIFFLVVVFLVYAKDLPRPEKFTERHLPKDILSNQRKFMIGQEKFCFMKSMGRKKERLFP